MPDLDRLDLAVPSSCRLLGLLTLRATAPGLVTGVRDRLTDGDTPSPPRPNTSTCVDMRSLWDRLCLTSWPGLVSQGQ